MIELGTAKDTSMEAVSSLRVEIKNSTPVELTDFAECMNAFANEYSRYTHGSQEEADGSSPKEVKLYVKEVNHGSIIADLMAMAPGAVFAAQNADTIIQFGKHVCELMRWYINLSGAEPENITKPTLQSLNSILEPVAKDGGASLNIGTLNNTGSIVVNIHIDNKDANAAQNNIRRHIEQIQEPVTGLHENVVIYWVQARNQTDNKTGDKGRIESIYRGDVKVVFPNESLKSEMLYGDENPFKAAFLVDVVVETIHDKPVVYKVVRLHEVFER